ncbi:hypothetical protein P7C70_g8320, partial [Phenoliferia sp. Uapishka_3]
MQTASNTNAGYGTAPGATGRQDYPVASGEFAGQPHAGHNHGAAGDHVGLGAPGAAGSGYGGNVRDSTTGTLHDQHNEHALNPRSSETQVRGENHLPHSAGAGHNTSAAHPVAKAEVKSAQREENKIEKKEGLKPTLGDKLSGTVEATMGKIQKNPAKVEQGEVKKTQGKVAAEQVGVAGHVAV